ncbi:MAG: hydrogenase nickel incorporation protein HypB [Lachnospiraceae bacterium]|jgi:hydrogenase nickel incorporation protein HypB|nr:hydrogenase nickel incorporation protein HypB [Lachnospiraceae bacterium]MCI1397298.1 hydrogenase nickel incorporation protein HypB [Lachnospiraceae bacterium]MCI1423308.1 hydrogenase nickel incorporation protein HypB [Lachnospiraceae bacterium]MCI1452172.1 hydrogenase nickel incorporation protein HypB [Lachnospiraceae bacterium]MDD5848162.1 hydrogenase nickel incorporation protein HypB [Bacillota bacterium]
MAVKVVEVNESVYAANDHLAEEIRGQLKAQKTFLCNVMASPGAGKSSVLLRTISLLRERYAIGVMEADIDATVDAEKMARAGVQTIQIHTGGECAMNASMTKQGLDRFPTKDLDLVFLENIGNLVCPAEEDTGASMNLEILSVPEGDDKPLKYPLMFEVVQAVLINKIDTKDYFDFDDEKVTERIHALNPEAKIFFVSAKTGEGFDAWVKWLSEQADAWNR